MIGEGLGMKDDGRIIIRKLGTDVQLIRVKRYKKPTRALHGSVILQKPIDKPKQLARNYMRKKLKEEFVCEV
jgi:hypothetical protein